MTAVTYVFGRHRIRELETSKVRWPALYVYGAKLVNSRKSQSLHSEHYCHPANATEQRYQIDIQRPNAGIIGVRRRHHHLTDSDPCKY